MKRKLEEHYLNEETKNNDNQVSLPEKVLKKRKYNVVELNSDLAKN